MKNRLNQQLKNQSIRRTLFLVSLFLLCSACASDPKKPSPVVTQVVRIQDVLNQLSEAYQDRNQKALFSKFDPGSKQLDAVREGVLQDFERFSSATLSFVIDRVETEETSFQTVLRWRAAWKKTPASAPLEKEGEGVFLWVDPSDPKLSEIRGGSPFGALSRAR